MNVTETDLPATVSTNWRWAVWAVYITLWTAALIIPMSDDSPLHNEQLTWNLRTCISKALHVVAYAGLTILGGWLILSAPGRMLLMFGLMAHATATEVLQVAIGGRSGMLLDVMFDHIGIALGLIISWKNWFSLDERTLPPC